MQRLAAVLAVALALPSAGCGAPEPPPRPAGPPEWRAARDGARPEGGVEVDVQAPVPGVALLRLYGADGAVLLERRRPLAAGEACRLWASLAAKHAPERSASIAAEDKAAGRREAWMVSASVGWDGAVTGARHQLQPVRPGLARTLGPWHVLAPTGPQPLGWAQERDLAALALVDGGADATLEGREHGSRLAGRLDAAAGDRAVLLRVTLTLVREAP
jgi:hypothetical protein